MSGRPSKTSARSSAKSSAKTPAIGIGASAGGIEALELLFRNMPADTGMAFIIVTHLSPDRESLLPEIIARFTAMPVHPVRHGATLGANCVYVLPENALVGLADGVLQLSKLDAARRERRPIDIFFSALAKDLGEYCGGVILSGGDGDGTLGIKAIKERGGLTMAQTANGTRPAHPDMPDSAIASGMIDFAVPAEQMGEKLAQFARSLRLVDGMAHAEQDVEKDGFEEAQGDIYRLLRNQIGHDFSGYKTKTFHRRIQRRMQVTGLDTVAGYVERLRQDPGEVAALFRDLLINVTNFFRDAEAFEALAALVIPKLFEGKGAEDTVRVWVPGCATGEEVYSIAILMREHMDHLRGLPRVQIFATDIDDRSLTAARAARYPDALLDSVSPERRRRFFTPDGGAFVVAKEVRDLCIFSPHSVIRDPPFSRMDMVSCRNLLIYFGPDVQDQVIPTFHYSLRPGGYLFLGTSENVSQHSDLFAPIEKTLRIFRAREDVRPRVHVPMMLSTPRMTPAPAAATLRGGGASLRQAVETHVMERFAPAHVVVNPEGDVVYYSSRTGKYLEAAPGAPSRSVLTMARKGLRLELRSALRDAIETRRTAVRENATLQTEEDRVQFITLTVDPMGETAGSEPLFLITFTDVGPTLSREDAVGRVHGQPDEAVAHLERELRDTRDRLQSMIEEYETALEELKSSNEELVSVNEELQSTNEELEASKEELQSLNEELQTVNIELSHKVDALDQTNSDLYNLFEATQIATVFLDAKLLIRNFTPPLSQLFNILPTDRGRPLTDFTGRLVYQGLHHDIRRTLTGGQPHEEKVSSEDGRIHYLARLRPYRGPEGDIEGVIATFVDVTILTDAEAHQGVLIAELNHRVKTMLGVVAAITRQTAKGAESVAGFTDTLVDRLQSMAQSYELLSQESWTEAPIEALMRQELDPLGAERVILEGDTINLPPKPALSLCMILHELATNAVKYGGLSTPEGGVRIRWSAEGAVPERRLRLEWKETGGPQAAPRKGHGGFGLKLIEQEAGYNLKGAARFHWEPGGLRVELDLMIG